MLEEAASRAPIFIVADDDREASDRMIGMCSAEFFYIPVRTCEEALRYHREFGGPSRITGVFVSETVPFGDCDVRDGLAALLRENARVVILAELPDPASIARWKERGALDCIAHPTKARRRTEVVRDVLQALMVAQLEEHA